MRRLPPFTTVLIRTVNSLYRVVILPGPEIYIQGGLYFPNPTRAYLDGAATGRMVKLGWIRVGLAVLIRAAGQRVITSPVRAIAMDQRRRS